MIGDAEKEAEYVSKRLSSSRDDRCNQAKHDADALLRGSIGVRRANRVIEAIDDLKKIR